MPEKKKLKAGHYLLYSITRRRRKLHLKPGNQEMTKDQKKNPKKKKKTSWEEKWTSLFKLIKKKKEKLDLRLLCTGLDGKCLGVFRNNVEEQTRHRWCSICHLWKICSATSIWYGVYPSVECHLVKKKSAQKYPF